MINLERKTPNGVIEIAISLANHGYKHSAVATAVGDTGVAMTRKLHGKGVNLVVVTHSVGYKEPSLFEFLRL